jgi:hypothetical protein
MTMRTQVPDTQGADTNGPMHQSIPFASTCPKCNEQQPQRGFSRSALDRLLKAGHPIEAYCVACDEFWSVTVEERREIAERLGAAC